MGKSLFGFCVDSNQAGIEIHTRKIYLKNQIKRSKEKLGVLFTSDLNPKHSNQIMEQSQFTDLYYLVVTLQKKNHAR